MTPKLCIRHLCLLVSDASVLLDPPTMRKKNVSVFAAAAAATSFRRPLFLSERKNKKEKREEKVSVSFDLLGLRPGTRTNLLLTQ